MRILIVIAVLLTALVAGGLVAVSRLVVWDEYREELTARALKRLVFLASFFAAPRMRRRLRSLGKGAES